MLADQLRQHDVDVRPRTDIYEYRRRIKTADEVEWITATENAGMAALQKAIDVIKAAEIRDGLLYHEGRKLTQRRPHLHSRERPPRARQQHDRLRSAAAVRSRRIRIARTAM